MVHLRHDSPILGAKPGPDKSPLILEASAQLASRESYQIDEALHQDDRTASLVTCSPGLGKAAKPLNDMT